MKDLILSLLISVVLMGCSNGPDPVKDYPEIQDYVVYDPGSIVEYEQPDSDYYLDPHALLYSIPSSVNTGTALFVDFDVKLAGSLTEGIDWSLAIENPLEGLKVKKTTLPNEWKVTGTLSKAEVTSLFSDDYTLKLKINPPSDLPEDLQNRVKYYNPPLNIKLVFNTEEN